LPTNKRVQAIGHEPYADGVSNALENMLFSIEHMVNEVIGRDPRPYQVWWNDIATGWNFQVTFET